MARFSVLPKHTRRKLVRYRNAYRKVTRPLRAPARKTYRFGRKWVPRAAKLGALAYGGYAAVGAYGGRAAAIGATRALANRYQFTPALMAAQRAYNYAGSRYIAPGYKTIRAMKASQKAAIASGRLAHYTRALPYPLKGKRLLKELPRLRATYQYKSY